MNFDAQISKQQLTWRLWGEEKTQDVIYTVYLKKVKYHRPLRSVSTDNEEDISHLEWETVRVKFIKAGSLEKLVENLISDDSELESTYINIFFATYRTFASSQQILTLILDRYEKLVNNEFNLSDTVIETLKKNVIVTIRVWLDTYPEDFYDPPLHSALHQLIFFVQRRLPESELLIKAKHKLQRLIAEDKQSGDVSPFCISNGASSASASSSVTTAPAGDHENVYKFPIVPCKHFAEQLTRIDTVLNLPSELFKKVIPHQCLGAVWSRRNKSRTAEAASIRATVGQFNAVSFRVMSTILLDPNLKLIDRATIISAWIDIAQELRVLKNFSSLKAIVSGLQSSPVYRLQKVWQLIPKEKVETFYELARIFSEENNQWAQRELLIKEGTAKFADTVGQNDRHLQKIIQRQLLNSGNISHGTVPYLGTFLTDLTMIDTAIPDHLTNGLINFDKKRKEFEVLAQIKLLQGAANAYNIREDVAFNEWFDSVLILDDKEAYRLSCAIESVNHNLNTTTTTTITAAAAVYNNHSNGGAGDSNNNINDNNNVNVTATSSFIEKAYKYGSNFRRGHRKSDSVTSTSSGSGCQFYFDISAENLQPSFQNSLERRLSSCSSTSSNISTDTSVSGHHNNNNNSRCVSEESAKVDTSTLSNGPLSSSSEFYIIRVTMETTSVETDGIVLYKSLILSNNERTQQVIRNAMLKLGMEGNPEEYSLSQVSASKELVLPPNANVFYALNTSYDLNFILRRKKNNPPKK